MKFTMKFFAFPLLLPFLFVSGFPGISSVTEDEWVKNYFGELKSTYDKKVPPEGINGPRTPIKVSSSMFILDINKVDDSNMDFNVQFYFRQSWNDSRLRFKGRTESLMLKNVNDIWTPDLFFVGEREGSLHQLVHPNIFCRINPDGEVRYSVKLSVTYFCPMDLRRFPHDIQKCQINIESYAYTANRIILEWAESKFPPVSAAKEISMLDFELIECTPSVQSVVVSDNEYTRLEVHLKFQRKFGFFAIRLYIPFILLVILSLLTLWINAAERGLRLALLLAILYLMVTISSEANSSIPPAPYAKASDVWVGFCESLVFATFLEFVVVALLIGRHHKEDCKSKSEILLNLESESKEQTMSSDSLKSHLNNLINMFGARNGGKSRRNTTAYRIDKICRFVFPVIFIIFNIVYWSVYCCQTYE